MRSPQPITARAPPTGRSAQPIQGAAPPRPSLAAIPRAPCSAAPTRQPRHQPIAKQQESEWRESEPIAARREIAIPPGPSRCAGAARPVRRYLVRDALERAELAAVAAEVQLRQRRPQLLLAAHQVQHPLRLQQRRHLGSGRAPPRRHRPTPPRRCLTSPRRCEHVTARGRQGPGRTLGHTRCHPCHGQEYIPCIPELPAFQPGLGH